MDGIQHALQDLAAQPVCGYQAGQVPATEPTALTALALFAFGQTVAARPALQWLRRQQADEGSIGVRECEPYPRWPTGLAVLAWLAAARQDPEGEGPVCGESAARAVRWALQQCGATQPRTAAVQHDTTIVAWPWVEGTHSWIEPTSLYVLALSRAGLGSHPRVLDGKRMLWDRQLPQGGCNYGNRVVLGETLSPHLQPTGLALLALRGESDTDGRLKRGCDYLRRGLGPKTTAASLGWGLLGLAAHDSLPPDPRSWLAAALVRVRGRGHYPLRLALLLLAAAALHEPGWHPLLGPLLDTGAGKAVAGNGGGNPASFVSFV